jgi:hypothetical protein
LEKLLKLAARVRGISLRGISARRALHEALNLLDGQIAIAEMRPIVVDGAQLEDQAKRFGQ